MTNEELHTELRNISTSSGDKQTLTLNALKKYSISCCERPSKIPVRSGILGRTEFMYVPCGNCYHCRETKQNEWVTRMYYEQKEHKFCYFVTLTFAPRDTYEEIPKKYLDCAWHRDDNNYHHHLCYSPCVFPLHHLSAFFRSLRRNLPTSSFKYVACTEFGKMFGRPHAHIIFFSDTKLTAAHIQKAWSFNNGTRKNPFYVPLGDIDYNDLEANGTISGDFKTFSVDGITMNTAASCFAYVAKYVSKSEKYNDVRVKYLYDNLKTAGVNYSAVVPDCPEYLTFPIFKDDFQLLDCVRDAFTEYIFRKRRFAGMFQNWLDTFYSGVDFYDTWKASRVDKILSQEDWFYFLQALEVPSKETLIYNFLQSLSYAQFKKLFAPCFTMSRGHGIASIYAESNAERFSKGDYSLAKIGHDDNFPLVLPKYFLRKAKEFLCDLSQVSHNGLSTSTSCKTFALFRTALLKYYDAGYDYLLDPFVLHGIAENRLTAFTCGCTGEEVNYIFRSPYAFVSSATSFRHVFYWCTHRIADDNGVFTFRDLYIISARFHPSSGNYIVYSNQPFARHLSAWVRKLDDFASLVESNFRLSWLSVYHYESSKKLCNSLLPFSMIHALDVFFDASEQYRITREKASWQLHKFINSKKVLL